MERDVLRKAQAEQQKATPENQEQAFDLKTAGPLELQQMIGNRATTSLLRGSGGTAIQTKLTVTDSNDQYEKEADSVAEQIVSGNAQTDVQRAAPEEDEAALKRIQRTETEEEQVETEEPAEQEADAVADSVADTASETQQQQQAPAGPAGASTSTTTTEEATSVEEESVMAKRIQRAAGAEFSDDDLAQPMRIQRQVDMSKSFDVGGDIEDQIRSTGGGQSLDTGIQAKMEAGTGHDFSNVRVHTDSQADALSESLGARAFTTGSDIFFKSGEYNPGTSEGDKLIAHESTHVIQQGGTQLKRDED